jgi:hypothetical protein
VVLLRSCGDWTEEERLVASKLLSCMGITVAERRTWLAKLRLISSRNCEMRRYLIQYMLTGMNWLPQMRNKTDQP